MADDNKIKPLAGDVDEEGTLIKSFPLAESVNDDDDLIIETQLPQTEHIHADKLREYMMAVVTDTIYPVGSIYMTMEETSPEKLFGGTWERIAGSFLVGAGSDFTVGAKGGSQTVTLSTSNLPSHTHSLPSHTHSFSATTGSRAISGGFGNFAVQSSSVGATAWGDFSVYNTQGESVGYATSRGTGSGTSYSDNVSFSNSHTHSVSGTTGSTSGTSGSTGSGSSFSILPPYMAVYMWRRTA